MFIFKRVFKITCFLVLMGVIFAVGAYVLPDFDSINTPPPPPPVYIPPEPDDPVYTELGAPAVTEYGQMAVINNNSDPFHAYIRYPQAGNPADAYIQDWAYEIYENMAAHYSTGVSFSPAEFGEMNIQYDSYLIDNRYASVHFFGDYSYMTTQLPEEIMKTFNIDLTEFRLLETGDILDMENPDAVLSLLSLRLLVQHPKTDGYHIYMDESWLSYLYITHEGIMVILPHDEFLPDSFDTLTVLLPYQDLGSSLLIRRSAPLPEMPTPPPDGSHSEALTTPTPDPATEAVTEDGSSEDDGETEGADPEDAELGTDPDSADPDGDLGDVGDLGDLGTVPDDAVPDDSGSGPEDGSEGEEPSTEEDTTEYDEYADVPPQSWYVNPDKPTVALTFDDGANGFTEELLDIMERYGARATFFTPGKLVTAQYQTLRRAAGIDCEVAGHSWNHKNLAKMSADDVRMQLETTQSEIETIIGSVPNIFRPPYGAVSDTMKAVSEELGLIIVNWNTDPEDWKDMDAGSIVDAVMEQVADRAIIISHGIYGQTIEAYKKIIPMLLLEGYQIATVSELFSIADDKPVPGNVYYSGNQVDMIG